MVGALMLTVLLSIIFEYLRYPIVFKTAHKKVRHSLVSLLFSNYSLGSQLLSLNLSSLTKSPTVSL